MISFFNFLTSTLSDFTILLFKSLRNKILFDFTIGFDTSPELILDNTERISFDKALLLIHPKYPF